MKSLIFIVSYNAEAHLEGVFRRIPYDRLPAGCEILVIDDASPDATFEVGQKAALSCPIPTRVLKNPKNLGYGGNQKLGYEIAIEEGFDAVVLLHGDGQYAPELLDAMLAPILVEGVDVVLGSRMLKKQDALAGGMPLYKWVGNQVLTWLENRILGMELSEFHTGLRAYRVSLLDELPIGLNSNDFHFDTDILIQCHRSGARFHEIPIPTRYGDEVCHVDGWKYFFDCLRSCARDWMTQKGIFYCRKFDLDKSKRINVSKVDLTFSSHQLAVEHVPPQSDVLDLGGGNMWVADALSARKQCNVTVVDKVFRSGAPKGVSFLELDLMRELPHLTGLFGSVLALDILEHLPRGRQIVLLEFLRRSQRPQTQFLISVPNTAFLPIRIVFFFMGHLNYGREGILDDTHAFLFTLKTFRELVADCGFSIKTEYFTSPPYELALGRNWLVRVLTHVNQWLAGLFPSLFAYQIVAECHPLPTVDELLSASLAHSRTIGAGEGARNAVEVNPGLSRRVEDSQSA